MLLQHKEWQCCVFPSLPLCLLCPFKVLRSSVGSHRHSHFCSFSFHSDLVGTVLAWWFRALITPSLCSSGWCESNSEYRTVCVGFLYTSLLRLLSSSVCTAQSKRGRLFFQCQLDVTVNVSWHTCWMWCWGAAKSLKTPLISKFDFLT